jgi:hypothetical protein
VKKFYKALLEAVCAAAAAALFLSLCFINLDALGEFYAPCSFNVEINKEYARNMAIVRETHPNAYYMSPTTAFDPDLENVIMHVNVSAARLWNPAIQLPVEDAPAVLAAIDHIAVFVGNKLFYFSHDEVQRFRRTDREDGYALYYFPPIQYEKSPFFKSWVNYYGDINFVIKALAAFFKFPLIFWPVYLLLALLLYMYRKQVRALYAAAQGSAKTTGIILLILITALGFILRWNGYVRHSGWDDELFSAVRAGNPALPFISVFSDPGNPPFYYILLRCWFIIFGWSEESGTMLSVLLGTGSIVTLYLLVKPFLGRKAALCAALFVTVSGFSIGYSQDMRSYILKMFLAPLISLALFNWIKKPSIKNLALYVLPSIGMVNTHYYGILFIMANFLFYLVLTLYTRQRSHRRQWKEALCFAAGNIIIALSFLPFFLYMIFVRHYDFSRGLTPNAGHFLVFLAVLVLISAFFVFRKKTAQKNSAALIVTGDQAGFTAYLLLTPVFIFMLAFVISFFKPMISFRYVWPICAPFGFALAAAGIFLIQARQGWRFLTPLLVYVFVLGLSGITPDIPGGGFQYYKEGYSYIAADMAAHPERSAAMLNSVPAIAAYYRCPEPPVYAPPPDVLYLDNTVDINWNEFFMYRRLRQSDIDDSRILKIYFARTAAGLSDGGIIFKKYR